MIYAHDEGRMCNNILQFGHVHAWAQENGRECVSLRFAYRYHHFHICHTRRHNVWTYLFVKLLWRLGLIHVVRFNETRMGGDEKERQMKSHRNVVVTGWHVRYYDLFIKHLPTIRGLFRILTPYLQRVRANRATRRRHDMARRARAPQRLPHIPRGRILLSGRGVYWPHRAIRALASGPKNQRPHCQQRAYRHRPLAQTPPGDALSLSPPRRNPRPVPPLAMPLPRWRAKHILTRGVNVSRHSALLDI